MSAQQRLGALLVEMGFIDHEQLEAALEAQEFSKKRLGKILVEAAIITEDRLTRALSRQLGLEVCSPSTTPIHERVLSRIPVDVATEYQIVPMALKREESAECIFIATSDPLDRACLDAVRKAVGTYVRVRWLLAGAADIELAIAEHYKNHPSKSPSKESTQNSDVQVIQGVPNSPPAAPQRSHPSGSGDVQGGETETPKDKKKSDSNDFRMLLEPVAPYESEELEEDPFEEIIIGEDIDENHEAEAGAPLADVPTDQSGDPGNAALDLDLEPPPPVHAPMTAPAFSAPASPETIAPNPQFPGPPPLSQPEPWQIPGLATGQAPQEYGQVQSPSRGSIGSVAAPAGASPHVPVAPLTSSPPTGSPTPPPVFQAPATSPPVTPISPQSSAVTSSSAAGDENNFLSPLSDAPDDSAAGTPPFTPLPLTPPPIHEVATVIDPARIERRLGKKQPKLQPASLSTEAPESLGTGRIPAIGTTIDLEDVLEVEPADSREDSPPPGPTLAPEPSLTDTLKPPTADLLASADIQSSDTSPKTAPVESGTGFNESWGDLVGGDGGWEPTPDLPGPTTAKDHLALNDEAPLDATPAADDPEFNQAPNPNLSRLALAESEAADDVHQEREVSEDLPDASEDVFELLGEDADGENADFLSNQNVAPHSEPKSTEAPHVEASAFSGEPQPTAANQSDQPIEATPQAIPVLQASASTSAEELLFDDVAEEPPPVFGEAADAAPSRPPSDAMPASMEPVFGDSKKGTPNEPIFGTLNEPPDEAPIFGTPQEDEAETPDLGTLSESPDEAPIFGTLNESPNASEAEEPIFGISVENKPAAENEEPILGISVENKPAAENEEPILGISVENEPAAENEEPIFGSPNESAAASEPVFEASPTRDQEPLTAGAPEPIEAVSNPEPRGPDEFNESFEVDLEDSSPNNAIHVDSTNHAIHSMPSADPPPLDIGLSDSPHTTGTISGGLNTGEIVLMQDPEEPEPNAGITTGHELRQALLGFVAGIMPEEDNAQLMFRSVIAVLEQEGLLDEIRLERALKTVQNQTASDHQDDQDSE